MSEKAIAWPLVAPLAAGALDTHAVPFDVNRLPLLPGDVKPVPPCPGDKGVVNPDRLVMFELAPAVA